MDDLVLRVAPVDSIWSQDDEVVIMSDLLSTTLGLRYNEVLHLVIAKGATDTEFPVDAIKEYTTVGSFNPGPFIRPNWRVLRVELHPASVFACKSSDGVTNVGYCEATVQNDTEEARRTVWAAILARDWQEFLVKLFKHYNKERNGGLETKAI